MKAGRRTTLGIAGAVLLAAALLLAAMPGHVLYAHYAAVDVPAALGVAAAPAARGHGRN